MAESSSSPHHHLKCESAIYVLKGHGRFITDPHLEQELVIKAGDFIYVPAKVKYPTQYCTQP